MFDLDTTTSGAYLHHRSDLGEFFLASDSVIPTFTRWITLKPHSRCPDQASVHPAKT